MPLLSCLERIDGSNMMFIRHIPLPLCINGVVIATVNSGAKCSVKAAAIVSTSYFCRCRSSITYILYSIYTVYICLFTDASQTKMSRPWLSLSNVMLLLRWPVQSRLDNTQLKSPAIIRSVGVYCIKSVSSVLKKASLSARFAVPDGAYKFIMHVLF